MCATFSFSLFFCPLLSICLSLSLSHIDSHTHYLSLRRCFKILAIHICIVWCLCAFVFCYNIDQIYNINWRWWWAHRRHHHQQWVARTEAQASNIRSSHFLLYHFFCIFLSAKKLNTVKSTSQKLSRPHLTEEKGIVCIRNIHIYIYAVCCICRIGSGYFGIQVNIMFETLCESLKHT